jgi:hypothetical protein
MSGNKYAIAPASDQTAVSAVWDDSGGAVEGTRKCAAAIWASNTQPASPDFQDTSHSVQFSLATSHCRIVHLLSQSKKLAVSLVLPLTKMQWQF